MLKSKCLDLDGNKLLRGYGIGVVVEQVFEYGVRKRLCNFPFERISID